jgi:outer membrane protein
VLGKDNGSTISFSDQFSQNKNQSLNFGLSIPVFNKLQVKTNVEIAKLNIINANYDKELVVNDLTQNINSIKAQFLNAQENITYWMPILKIKSYPSRNLKKIQRGTNGCLYIFCGPNGWLQANYNLISSKNDVIQQTELKVLQSEF